MKQCRIMITRKCNLRCPYCLMNNRRIMAGITPATLEDILKTQYSAFCITGGEPLLDAFLLLKVIDAIRKKQPKAKRYIYTNGTQEIITLMPTQVNGVNIGVHGRISYTKLKDQIKAMRCFDSNYPIRIHRQDIEVDRKLRKFCSSQKVNLKVWHKDVCETVDEDRFILKEAL